MAIPTQYNHLMPYLVIPGAHQFIEFMKYVFDATVQVIVPRSEGVVMHGEMRIRESVIMFADATDQLIPSRTGIFIYVDNVDETYRKALANGAFSKMEPGQQSYGYTCGFQDPFGIDWWPAQIPA